MEVGAQDALAAEVVRKKNTQRREPFSTCVNHACLACPSCVISLGGHMYIFASGIDTSAVDTCSTVAVNIGGSTSNTKTVTPPEPVASCISPCDRNCRLNNYNAGDTFRVTVLDNGDVQVKRTDTGGGWGMNLIVPCYRSMAILRVSCGSGCIGCRDGLRRDVGTV